MYEPVTQIFGKIEVSIFSEKFVDVKAVEYNKPLRDLTVFLAISFRFEYSTSQYDVKYPATRRSLLPHKGY